MQVDLITSEEVKRRMDAGEAVLFIDARNPTAWASSNEKLPGALRIPAAEVPSRLSELPRGRPIVAYCT
jgi:rhodanese-related sulfurtransferase